MIRNSEILRWRAVIKYQSNIGVVDVEHYFDELRQLQDIVEYGPSFDALILIEVTRLNADRIATIEETERL